MSVMLDSEIESVETTTIDETLKQMNINATFIKMDIEGSELAALRGAEQLIRKNHPRLAVCIYHRSQDIVEIYQFLQQFEYRFYLRQHAFSAEETVLYAV